MLADLTVFLYILIGVISTVGTGLFVWWMVKHDWWRSVVFCYVTLLLMGEAIRSWVSLMGRYTLLYYPEQFPEFTCSWVWSGRLILTFLSVTALVAHMIYRAATKDKQNGL